MGPARFICAMLPTPSSTKMAQEFAVKVTNDCTAAIAMRGTMKNSIYVAAICVIAASACTPVAQQADSSVAASPIASGSSAFSERDTVLSHAGRNVTLHPETRLMASNHCSSMVTSRFYSQFGFDNTLIALRNRAALIGSNAVAVRSWTVADNDATIVARFYNCRSKSGL